MRIHVYGCSWSGGVSEVADFSCWPRELAKLEPSWNIYNFALGGTSVHFSSYNWLWSKRNIQEPIYHIFQCTGPYRWTSVPQNLNPMEYMSKHKHIDNYMSFLAQKNIIREVIDIYQIKKQETPPRHLSKYYKNKIKFEHEDQWEIERYSIFESMRNNVNLAFFHRYHDSRGYKKFFDNNVFCIADTLGKEKFYDYVDDTGHHFGVEGMQWQAKYIRDYITENKQ